jgi:multidrug efflux pump subunit AcrA (membrane-fusion protein)
VVYIVNPRRVESRPVTVLRRGRDQIAIASGVGEGDRVSLKEPEQEGAAK